MPMMYGPVGLAATPIGCGSVPLGGCACPDVSAASVADNDAAAEAVGRLG